MGPGRKEDAMGEAFETAAAFARQLIEGRGKDAIWRKRARALVTAAYQVVAQEEGKTGEPCEARALELLGGPEAMLLERIGRSIAVSVSMQAKLFNRLSPPQRASILAALSAAAGKQAQPGGIPRGDPLAAGSAVAHGIGAVYRRTTKGRKAG
jgi:hypothetical protein